MTIVAQTAEVVRTVVDQASVASDRWLFLFTLSLFIVGGSVCIRWLVASNQTKDTRHEAAMILIRDAHAKERAEWRVIMDDSKKEFLEALATQRVDFRSELAEERKQFASERILDRESRHESANAVNAVALALVEHRETLIQAKHHGA